MKTYGQRCPLARALDRIGERWTLLVVRELLLGPRRYTDLLDSLPGVGTNILAARLADLQAAELVTKRTLPRPAAVTVYQLTEAGQALAPSIRALSEWGDVHGAPSSDAQAVRPAWILLGVARREAQLDAGRSCELRVGDDVFELVGTDTGIAVAAGAPRPTDAVITMEPETLYALASGRTTPEVAFPRVDAQGDASVVARVLGALSGVAS
jgi:DNA-binding HxlR family transcriptional regulator